MTKAAGPVIERPKPKQKKPDFDQISAKLDQARARLEEIAETMRVKRSESMTISTQALRMRLELKRLAQAHRVQAEPNPIPLTAPTTTAMVFEGYAATIDVDLDRTKLRPYVLGFPLSKTFRSVPLLFKHDPNVVAGKIEDLDYDDEGNIVILGNRHPRDGTPLRCIFDKSQGQRLRDQEPEIPRTSLP